MLLLVLSLLFVDPPVTPAPVTTVYLFPGQGSDERLFQKFQLPEGFRVVHIQYPEPSPESTLVSYANVIKRQINTDGLYVFIGVSMGGMICSELADIMHPEKVIIISSARSNDELPSRYTFQREVPLNRWVPATWIKSGAQLMQPLVEPDSRQHRELFSSMLAGKSPDYFKRTVNMIINWQRTVPVKGVIHIHGDRDRTLPISRLSPDVVISGGSHMMTLTRGEEINDVINSLLSQPGH